MLILGKRKQSVPILFTVLIIFVSKSTSEDGLQVKTDNANRDTHVPVTSKLQERVPEDKENAPSSSAEEKIDGAIAEKSDQTSSPEEKEENQYAKSDESDLPPQVDSELRQFKGIVEEAVQQPSAPQEKKLEDANTPQKLSEAKKQNVKIDDDSRKISLTDVNSITNDESDTQEAKRETRPMEFLGLPRDASYFFDDLEPFINYNRAKENLQGNLQDNSRSVRAVPAKENKALKAKFGKKDMLDEDMEEEEEEEQDDNEKVEEEERASGGDCDDEDMEPDSEPTTVDPCDTTTECVPPTTECSPTTKFHTTPHTRKTTTNKCTTKFTCPTKCPTTVESTKCPKICAKANHKSIGYPVSTKRTPEWDDVEPKRESILQKKKVHNKLNCGKQVNM